MTIDDLKRSQEMFPLEKYYGTIWEEAREKVAKALLEERARTLSSEAVQSLIEYTRHEERCASSGWEAGEPTEDGGYRTKIRGKWYKSRPIDETPKCDCGLDSLLEKFQQFKDGKI